MTVTSRCPRCGAVVAQPAHPKRTRIWCSESCRLKDYRARQRDKEFSGTTTEEASPEAQAIGELESLSAEWNTADRFQDDDLTSQALRDRREAMKTVALQAHSDAVNTIAADASKRAEKAREKAMKFALAPDKMSTSDALAAWRENVKPSIETGAVPDWTKVIAHAGPDELAAIAKFAAAWIRRTTKEAGQAEQTINELDGLVQRRWFAIHPDDAAREALATSDAATATATAVNRAARELKTGRIRSRSMVAALQVPLKMARIQ
jgi:endogenous inhibitor of DNA gyrase (YacG/DUF329 family)